MNIAVTGYYGTGSSAIVDLLSEFDNVKCAIGNRYEHYPLLGKDALLDLEARLFNENTNYMIKDHAISCFIDEMYRQNDNNFGWLGSYKELFGDKFKNMVDEFVNEISVMKAGKSFTQLKKIRFSPIKAILQIGARIVYKRKIAKLGRVYVYDKKPMRFLTVDHEQFMQSAKRFINKYFEICQVQNFNMIYDHLLLPEQSNVLDKFFDNNLKLIVVDRDPRDIYISCEHIWSTAKFGCQQKIYPDGLDGFCKYWASTHEFLKTFKPDEHPNVLLIQFEDLVYNYEDTVKKIMAFCNLEEKDHTLKKQIFNPDKSINNTQVFNLNEDYKKESEEVASKLNYLLYTFPYERKTDYENIFDN